MTERPQQPSTHSRRIFFTAGVEHFQMLSLSQRPDGSIYISGPDLAESRWMEIVAGNPPTMRIVALPEVGKLSVHGSGVAHVRRANGGETELRLAGNYLSNEPGQTLGLRHLVTVLPTQPTHLPASAANARLSDCSILAQELKPYVLVFWAVPATRRLTVNVTASFHVDDLESVPPESGFGGFALRTHWVVWFAYRTKHMQRWPTHSHLCFHDGFHTPILIGTGEGACRLELRRPKYSLDGDQLRISV